ncbi:hypothetical protein P2318_24135 [Myxococcaceae bacterium GXIMD 01537]
MLDGDGKYAVAMALALGSVWDETAGALVTMVSPEALLATVISAGTMYLLLWTLPEPCSKALAASLTLALGGYLGFDTVWRLIDGWLQLVASVDRAVTFDELRHAGERYGRVMGENAARLFVMLTMAALGRTGALLVESLPSLPGGAQASMLLASETGIEAGSLASVQSVSLGATSVVLALAPGAVAMTAREASSGGAAAVGFGDYRAWRSFKALKKARGSAGEGKQWHHIVEQTDGNVQRFGPEALHNTQNVIPIEEAIHRRISGFYSSIQPFTRGKTVREWLSSQGFEAQREFGLKVLRDFGVTP